MFSIEEGNRRLKAASDILEGAGIRAFYLTGNSTVGPNAFGYYRYFTDSRVIFSLSSVVLPAGGEPVAVVNNLMGKLNLINNSFIKDAVINQDQLGGVIEILKSRGIDSGRVGILPEVMPASWLLRLRQELPDVELVDVSELLFPIRTVKSEEEVETQRICAKIADAGYKAVCDKVRPGMYESEVVAEMDREMQRLGSEESFALITSGKFSIGKNDLTPLHNYSACNRRIEKGDVVALEITPRYRGYWTQLVRTVCVGEQNNDADEFRRVVVGAIGEAKKILKAQTPVGEVVKKIREYVEACGYKMVMPCGHIAAIDLNEERMTEDNTRPLEAGMLVIIHPTVITGDMKTGIFWGESYLITEDGFEAPMQSGSEMYTSVV